MPPRQKKTAVPAQANDYRHAEQALARPDVGTQPQFKKRAAPRTYRYDSSLSPALDWDGQNAAREQGEALIREVLEAETLETAKAAAKLKALSKPFLDWAGKAERLSFDVPTLPLFVHERLSLIRSARSTSRCCAPMIYTDPPYGVKFGSNFQSLVRKRDVAHNDDEGMTRELEMVQAYRDAWELGLHSCLSYLRDRLLLCRELLVKVIDDRGNELMVVEALERRR